MSRCTPGLACWGVPTPASIPAFVRDLKMVMRARAFASAYYCILGGVAGPRGGFCWACLAPAHCAVAVAYLDRPRPYASTACLIILPLYGMFSCVCISCFPPTSYVVSICLRAPGLRSYAGFRLTLAPRGT